MPSHHVSANQRLVLKDVFPKDDLQRGSDLKWDSTKYLGVWIPKNMFKKRSMKVTMVVLLRKLKHTLTGGPYCHVKPKIEMIKMNVFPQTLYLLQSLSAVVTSKE